MNAHTLLKYFTPAHWQHAEKKDFPTEAYSYDSPIEPEEIAKIQKRANEVLDKQEWTVIERLGDGRPR